MAFQAEGTQDVIEKLMVKDRKAVGKKKSEIIN
jgi:hypothetical protein